MNNCVKITLLRVYTIIYNDLNCVTVYLVHLVMNMQRIRVRVVESHDE